MKSDIIKKSKQIAIPNNTQRKKVDKIANQVFSLVNKEAKKQKAVVSVHFGGSYAKETWTPEKIDIDIFVKFKKTTSEKNFETIGKKIGFDSLKKFKPYVRYSEHPFVEADIDGVGVNVVPCYDIKKGEWKSAADRSTFHTEFMSEKLTGSMKDDIRILKCFLKINGMYGAEIAKQGFSGYVCEVLVYYLGSFENVLKKISKLKNNEMVGESPRKFDSPLVIIDPIDRNRNLGAAISIQNVTNFILIARNFLKENSISYFKEKSKNKIPAELARNTLVINFKYKKRSDDIIYGQIKRAATSLESQMNKEGFNVLRSDAVAYDETNASLLFLLESLSISKNEIRTGPDVFSGDFSTKFIHTNSKKSKLMWTDKEGKLQSLQTRRYENAKSYINDLIKNHMNDSGIPKGLRTDFKAGFQIKSGKDKQSTSVKKSISKLITTDDTAFSTN
ncbi:MAG TPA: CCA tRNA nucleotidyltransferase [Candidatus Nitrosopelagicus sp.]|nr:CCA tRNA nucleotidyltransferase [Candidatus Nitrosopelagicus sp.]|tara:strand:+ start:1585 stop:2925 length:1341 start_codon:yes stop_codon:yes gene_type:complete